MKPSRSRSRILDSARAEFASFGFAGARVERIAKGAGVNKQLIYYYFGSKARLHAAATASSPPPFSQTTAASNAVESLRSVIEELERDLEARPDLVSLLVDRAVAGEARESAARWVGQAEDRIASVVSRGLGLGYFRDDADPHAVARQALVLCIGHLALAHHLSISASEWTRLVADTLARATAW